MRSIEILDPYLLCDRDCSKGPKLSFVKCKGGGGGSNEEYEKQLEEQRKAREKAEAQAEHLRGNQAATATKRQARSKASMLSGETGDSNAPTRKSVLGSGS